MVGKNGILFVRLPEILVLGMKEAQKFVYELELLGVTKAEPEKIG